MEEERRLALKYNYESPIWDTLEATHEAYDLNMEYVLKNLKASTDYLLIASHNRGSCDKAKVIILQNRLSARNVCFGQLKGFSDSLTLSLSEEGFNVLKYLPYGPTEYLIPYLIRRGHESKQVMREHLLLNDITGEIKTRLNPKTYL
jgi:proline dehydrogenase